MDILTQGLLGAAMAQSAAPGREVRRALGIGFFAGLLADADVLIQSEGDALLTLEYHRHFTHALLFIPFGALLAALLLWPWLRKSMPFAAAYRYSLLGYLLSGVLDALTSYGTYLLWPFSGTRVAWNLIAVVDPLFTLLLLGGVAFAAIRSSARPVHLALGLCVCYLGFSAFQQSRVEQAMQQIAATRGDRVEAMVVKPTMGNVVLWRAIYLTRKEIVVDAMQAGATGLKHYPGGRIARITPDELDSIAPPGSVLHEDLRTFHHLSDGYLAWHPQRAMVIGDLRYAMLPDRLLPLWGIGIDPGRPERHAEVLTFRQTGADVRSRFICMLRGASACGEPAP